MYVKRTLPMHFPANYNGNLSNNLVEKDMNENTERAALCNLHKKYKVKKNIKHVQNKDIESLFFGNASKDDILLLGLIIFLYVGCDHSKENLLLIGILAYLLLGDKLGL